VHTLDRQIDGLLVQMANTRNTNGRWLTARQTEFMDDQLTHAVAAERHVEVPQADNLGEQRGASEIGAKVSQQ